MHWETGGKAMQLCEHVQMFVALTSLYSWQAADPPAHGNKGTQVLVKTLVSFLVQSSHGSELGPVKTAQIRIKNYPKC